MSKSFWQQLHKPILALAPMVGISDSAYRQLALSCGADVVYSEMIASEALVRRIPKALKMMERQPDEKPVVVQIMGNKPEVMAMAAQMIEASGAQGVDINFGCPAHKIARNYCGVMLMRDIPLSRSIIEAILEKISIPLSIKVRTSIFAADNQKPGERQRITISDFITALRDLPIAAIMVHGRSFEDPFNGPIDYQAIQEVKKLFTTGPVLANGGLTSVESAAEVLRETGADGLGLARFALGKPWVFKQIREYLNSGNYQEADWQEMKKTMQQHAQLYSDFYGSDYFLPMRRHLAHYVKGKPQAGELRQKLVQTNSAADVAKILEQYS